MGTLKRTWFSMSTARMPTPYFKPVGQVHQCNNNMAPVSGSYPVFSARRKTEQVDWRKIAALNIDQMIQAFDFNTLQENIYSITFCDIESEVDMRQVDPNYIKLFKLSQLTIEYLLNSQEYLTHQLGILEENIKQYQQNVEDAKIQCDNLQKEMAKVTKESHKRKKLLMAQQQLIHGVPGNYHKCSFCPKAFLHQSYLQKHISKRHADAAKATNTPVADGDTSSGHGSGSRSSIPGTNVISALENQLKSMKEDLMIVQERELQKEAEIKNLKKLFEERDNQYEADLVDLRRKLIKQSNIGSICDDDENDELPVVVSEKDVACISLEKKAEPKISEELLLEKKAQSLKKNFDKQFKKQEKKWQTEIENMKKKYEQEIINLQQKQKEATVIPSKLVDKPAKRKLNYSLKAVKINEAKMKHPEREKASPEVTLIRQVMPIEKSEFSDDDDVLDMETDEDDKDERDDDERKGDEVKEISSDHTMEYTMSTTGSLTERVQQVYQQVSQNSKIQQEMRAEMANLLSEKMEKIGLPQSTKGISKKTLTDKLSLMKKERMSKSKRFPNFEQERVHLNQLVEKIAQKKMETEYSTKDYVLISPKAMEKAQTNQGIVKVVQKQQPKDNVKKPLVVTKPPSPIISKKQSSVNLQIPSTSLHQNTLETKSQSSLAFSPSKQWPKELWKQDSEDDDNDNGKSDTWSDDDDEDDFVRTPQESTRIISKSSPPARPPPIKQSLLNKSQTNPQQPPVKSTSLAEHKQQQQLQQAAVAQTPPVPFPRTMPNIKALDMYDLDDDDDDDSDNWQNFNGRRTVPAQSSSSPHSSYKPKREPNVTRLGNIIEDKLMNRPSVQFAGAVNLLNKNETPKADDSDFSKISSLEDDFFDNKPQNPRFSSTPASKGHTETDASSNTYSTGIWGSSSKAVSSISASGSMGSNKQFTPPEIEWDSD